MASVNNGDVDAVLEACRTWAQQHHQTDLTIQERGYIRTKLKERVHNRMVPKPDQVELVTIAHRLANSAIANRRDAAALARSAG